MRFPILAATFALLLAGLLGLWAYRFERIPGTRTLNLADLKKLSPHLPHGAQWIGDPASPAMHLTMKANQPRIGVSIALKELPPMDALFIRFSMASHELQRGAQEWDDGRVMVEWLSPDGQVRYETDPLGSLRENQGIRNLALIARSSKGNTVPSIRIEHLGLKGEFELTQFEIIPVQERRLWIVGRWLLIGFFFIWFWFALAGGPAIPSWQRASCISLWLGMAVWFAVPGPWKTLRPLIADFRLGESNPQQVEKPNKLAPEVTTPDLNRQVISNTESKAFGKIPTHGSWIVQLKQKLEVIRPLVHAFLLFVPTLLFAFLVGTRLAVRLAFGMALSIEAAQAAFGYGFDWVDVLDLLTDTVGILGAIWLFGRCVKGAIHERSAGDKTTA